MNRCKFGKDQPLLVAKSQTGKGADFVRLLTASRLPGSGHD